MIREEVDFHLPLIQRVDLRVRDRHRLVDFYRRMLDLEEISGAQSGILLGGDKGEAILRLVEDATAQRRHPGTTGLYHVAFLLANRRQLAEKIAILRQMDWPLNGLVDHGVSQALYLSDPEGNGVELTVDKPYAQWPFQGRQVAMYTQPLSLERFVEEGLAEPPSEVDTAPIIGHVHLSVEALKEAEAFFVGQLHLQITQDTYPGALFFAKGAYHHHFAANSWARPGASSPQANTTGLIGCELMGEESKYLDFQKGYTIG